MALLFVSGVIFAQLQREGAGSLSSIKVSKEISSNYAVSNSKAVVDSLSYDGANSTSIGTGAAANFGVYAFFPATTLAPHATANHYILSVKVFISGISFVSASQLRFYTDTLASAMVFSQTFTPVEGWNNVILTTPFVIPSTGKLFIGYNLTTTGGYPAGCDAGPANTNGNWISMGSWAHLTDLAPTLIGNWNIRAMCGTLPTAPIASCSPLSWTTDGVSANGTLVSGNFTLTNAGAGTLSCTGITGLSTPFTTSLVPSSVSLATGVSSTFTFTYNPTAVGTNNQTVVIATNGGNITINLTGTCVPAASITWNFNLGIPAAFTLISDANIATVPAYAKAWVAVHDTSAISGDSCAASTSWFTPAATADRWMITNKMTLTTGNYLKWNARAYESGFPDGYVVKLSTTGNAKANFTNTLKTVAAELATWQTKIVDLSAYNGQNVYIAFVQNSNDMSHLRIDNIQILGNATVGINQVAETTNFSIYPNPVRNELNINSVTSLKNVKVINAIGQQIVNENTAGNHYKLNTSNYVKGVYFVQIETENGKSTKKFVVSE